METRDRREIGKRREADQHSGEGRRIEKERRIWSRRNGARGEMADGGSFDRRGEHPSLFAKLGFRLLRGVRRMDSARRSEVVRRYVDRRAP